MIRFPICSDQSTRSHLRNVYACLSLSMLAAAFGSGVHLFTDILKVYFILQLHVHKGNCDCLKFVGNVSPVIINHFGDQDTAAICKTTDKISIFVCGIPMI